MPARPPPLPEPSLPYPAGPTELALRWRTAGSFLVGYAMHLARGQLFVEMQPTLASGTPVRLRMRVPGTDGDLLATGAVAWERPEPSADGQPAGVGLHVDPLDEAEVGPRVDRLVSSIPGLRCALVGPGGDAHAALRRVARGVLPGKIEELLCEEVLAGKAAGFDLVVVDLDSGPHEALEAIERTARDGLAAVALSASPDLRARARAAGVAEALASPASSMDVQGAALRALSRPVRE